MKKCLERGERRSRVLLLLVLFLFMFVCLLALFPWGGHCRGEDLGDQRDKWNWDACETPKESIVLKNSKSEKNAV